MAALAVESACKVEGLVRGPFNYELYASDQVGNGNGRALRQVYGVQSEKNNGMVGTHFGRG